MSGLQKKSGSIRSVSIVSSFLSRVVFMQQANNNCNYILVAITHLNCITSGRNIQQQQRKLQWQSSGKVINLSLSTVPLEYYMWEKMTFFNGGFQRSPKINTQLNTN